METYLSLIKTQPAFHLCVNTGVSKHDGLLLETGKQIRQTHKVSSLRAFPAFLSSPVSLFLSLGHVSIPNHQRQASLELPGGQKPYFSLYGNDCLWKNGLLGVPTVPGQIFHHMPTARYKCDQVFLSAQLLSRSDYYPHHQCHTYLN